MITSKIGKLGEDLATLFFKRRGYLVLYRNYWKPYGEIDIVCQKQNKLYFIEVKSVSREINDNTKVTREISGASEALRSPALNREASWAGEIKGGIVSHESYGPEENVHDNKLQRLGRVIQVFLSEKGFQNKDWQFDVCVVEIDVQSKKSRIKMIENQLIPE